MKSGRLIMFQLPQSRSVPRFRVSKKGIYAATEPGIRMENKMPLSQSIQAIIKIKKKE